MDLLKAVGGEQYDYVHLLSGVDLPLHSQDWIHSYCEANKGDEFFNTSSEFPENALPCVNYHHFFLEQMCVKNILLRKMCSLIRHSIIALEKCVKFRRSYPMPLYKGGNWFRITDDMCRWMIDQEAVINKNFKHIHTADEIVPITLFSNSPYAVRRKWCKRMIDWKRGRPYTWRMEDLAELSKSDAFFARKFSTEHMDIVNAIRSMVIQEVKH